MKNTTPTQKILWQTYVFHNLPEAIVKDADGRGEKWTLGVNADVRSELGYLLMMRWTPVDNDTNMVLHAYVMESDAEELQCLLHNLHSGLLLHTRETFVLKSK